ncbi:histone H4-like TAF Taf6, SAGA complex subunit [Dimargaris verticillata]|uniref:TBP-associated factor 6 n=1 Tax=Dimargaris verticillata TaxID=2761393 RepID=A0A9W8BCL1_9FUNG|nr:histone H4-like TAF Taf6, SAGA complex subunit [Dimargaris verticillata]
MSVFPKETIRNISETLGIPKVKDEVTVALAQDVEYRVYEVIQEAIKFMRHSKRTKLHTEDIDYALRVRNVEPLYGYGAFGEVGFKRVAALSEDLYIIEDEELDFEKVLNAPLPPAPRDVTYTAHWLAIEGVQPAIKQNPAPSEPPVDHPAKKSRVNGHAAPALPGSAPVETRDGSGSTSQVKHVLSKELQLYYERVTEALLSTNDVLRGTALESLAVDPGIHQLLPYFTQFVAHQVTHNLKQLRTLGTMVQMVHALLTNSRLFMEPYLHQVMPALLTCLVGKKLGQGKSDTEPNGDTMDVENGAANVQRTPDHWELRRSAASLVATICSEYGQAYHTLQPRVTRTLLRAFLDPTKPFTTHYGAIVGLTKLGHSVVRLLLLPNVKAYTRLLEPSTTSNDTTPAIKDAQEHCWQALLDAIESLNDDDGPQSLAQPTASQTEFVTESQVATLTEFLGEPFTKRLVARTAAWKAVPSIIDAIKAGPLVVKKPASTDNDTAMES